tara:strand:+ start:830 stop:1144 length:315 start_codon:yes stop_codon:yes gene_type:complete
MNEQEKDCTDQLIECHSECDINDKECKEECIEEYHECEVPQQTASPIIEPDTTEYDEEGELIAELLCITGELGGTMERLECSNSQGRSSKVIKIEYNVKHKNET